MNIESEIRNFVDNAFKGKVNSNDVTMDKEEIVVNLIDKVDEEMKRGLTFNEAFLKARGELGDINFLADEISGSQNSNYKVLDKEPKYRLIFSNSMIIALTPFVYCLLGFMFNLWDIAWVIIPVTAIALSSIKLSNKIIAITPLFYVFVGLFINRIYSHTLIFRGLISSMALKWWAIGWIIIPVSAIILKNVKIVKE